MEIWCQGGGLVRPHQRNCCSIRSPSGNVCVQERMLTVGGGIRPWPWGCLKEAELFQEARGRFGVTGHWLFPARVRSFSVEEFFSVLRLQTRWLDGGRWSGLHKAGFQFFQTLQTLGREDYRWEFDQGFDAPWENFTQEMLPGGDESHTELWRMKKFGMQGWSVPRSHSRGKTSSRVIRWEAEHDNYACECCYLHANSATC